MKSFNIIFNICVILSFLIGCKTTLEEEDDQLTQAVIEKKIQTLNNLLVEAAKLKNFAKVANIYMNEAILLAEYNPLIDGKDDIEKYYTEIFDRQDITDYQKHTTEIFHLEETILEIGIFQKDFTDQEQQKGKYWNVWKLQEDGSLLLKAETFGFFYPIKDPSRLVVSSIKEGGMGMQSRTGVEIPIELDAYSALMGKTVRDRDTKKIVELYTHDGAYSPFADTTKYGYDNLLKHYTQYHSPPVVIDSIEGCTYDYEKVSNGIIRYTKFYVEWTVPNLSGKTEGTGMSYMIRQEDNSLKLHRLIGLHIHDEGIND
ncbi:MAG: hypothetical protein AAGI07_08430 [Bacteroidota bacterium]